MKRKICFITGARADYGLIYHVMKEVQACPEFELQLVAAGMHLCPEFGNTVSVISNDGFPISATADILLASDTPSAIASATGLGCIRFAQIFENLKPDIIVIPGDRFEMLAAAQTALFMKIPIAHLFGGDTTEGAYDEAIRHSISKMSHLHFVTNHDAAKRLRQLGENPEHIFNVGSPGIDYIRLVKLMSKEQLEESLQFSLRDKNILVTFHPTTLESISSTEQMDELIAALSELDDNTGIIFTRPNADNEGRALINMIDDFANGKDNVTAHASLGQQRYLSALSFVDTVVGNSSSGLYEAPTFKIPTVNIGDRQKGRLRAESVIDCPAKRKEISTAIQQAWTMDCTKIENPYGDGYASEKIAKILRGTPDYNTLLKKHFFGVTDEFTS